MKTRQKESRQVRQIGRRTSISESWDSLKTITKQAESTRHVSYVISETEIQVNISSFFCAVEFCLEDLQNKSKNHEN